MYFPHPESSNAEYVLSGSEDNLVAYRIVHVPDESPKGDQSIPSTSAGINSLGTNTQHLQYIVIDNSNGYLQAVPTTQITAVPSPIKVEQNTNSTTSNALKMRTSVAIAPKVEPTLYVPSTTYSTSTATNNTSPTKSSVNFSKFKSKTLN